MQERNERMEVDYNPQLGYRRTIFQGNYDFLVKPHSFDEEADGLSIKVDTYKEKQVTVKVSFLTETAFRFQMFPDEQVQEAKNPVFTFQKQSRETKDGNAEKRKTALKETDEWVEYGNGRLQLRFQKNYWEMSVYSDGKLLTKEQAFDTNVDNRWKCLPTGYYYDEEGRCVKVHETMYLFSDEAFWGFGEKFTDFNKRGQLLHCWQKDALSTNTEDSYKGHPFFISSRGYAVLLNTFTRSTFDMGNTSQVSYQMAAEDGYLDYIFLAETRGDYKSLLQQYIGMTGAIPMIPKWAFGFWMSKCTYNNRKEIEDVVLRAEKEGFPMDVIHIDFWQKTESQGTWEWDTERFPDPEGMIRWLKEHHVHLSIWNYPYLTVDSPAFGELEAKGYFVKNKEGKTALFYSMADSEYLSGCFDFTNPEFLKWYAERVMAVLRMGVSVIKTDFSEAVPEEAVYWDGTSGVEGHNKITYLYAKTIYGLMEKCSHETGNPPMLWGRSGFAGSHQLPAAWAGDSSSSMNNHSAILKGGLSLAMSGVAFWGFDLGGFYSTDYNGNECPPTEEEYLRSVLMGLHMPLSRAHGKTPREPWNFSQKVLDTVRTCVRGRYRMLPYLYDQACNCHLKGLPMLRPLLLEFPEDPVARIQELSYMLGDSLLVAPAFEREEYEVYLPKGKWMNLRTEELLEGGRFVKVAPGVDEIPVFLRENRILPLLKEEKPEHVPEGEFRNLEVTLVYQSEVNADFYDQDEQGNEKRYYFHAYPGKEQRTLRVDTDMDVCSIHLVSEQKYDEIYLNGSLL